MIMLILRIKSGLLLGVTLVLLGGCVDSVTGPDVPDGFSACGIWGVSGTAICGTVSVPEDRTSDTGQQIPLNVVVLKATGRRSVADPLFYLTGGPGSGATSAAGRVAHDYSSLRERRDIVLVDQRGTGESAALWCAPSPDIRDHFGTLFPAGLLEACRTELAASADLTQYGTSAAAQDLEDVRRALDYAAINLHGESYGTRLALEYLHQFPDAVRSLMLLWVAPSSLRVPLTFARDAEDALNALFDDCAAQGDCATRYPDLRLHFDRLRERLASGPVSVRLDAPGGTWLSGELSLEDFGYAVRGMLYGDEALSLPALITAAAEDEDLSPFARSYAARARTIWSSISQGLYLSVTCAEDVDRIRTDEIETETRNTFLADYMVRELEAACADWPRSQASLDLDPSPATDKPVLLISGRRDPVTPPRWAEAVRANMPNSVHVVFPFGSHGFTGTEDTGCVMRLQGQFVESLSVSRLDTSCVDAARPLRFR